MLSRSTSSRTQVRVSSGDLARRLIVLKRDWDDLIDGGLRGWSRMQLLRVHDEMDALLGILVDRGVDLAPIPCEWHRSHDACLACAGIAEDV